MQNDKSIFYTDNMKNKIKIIAFLLVVGILLNSQMIKSQGLINNGSNIVIETGAYLVVQGNILNQSSTNNGSFSLVGNLKLSGNFTNNATGGDAFSTNTGTITFNGSGVQEVNGTQATNFGDMVLANSVEFNDISQQAVSNINLSGGKLLIGDVDFKIASTATISGYSSSNYIVASGVGNLVRTINNGESVFFPVGTAVRYAPVTITQATGAEDGSFKVRVVDSVYLNSVSGATIGSLDKYVNKTWYIESTASNLNLDITLSWLAADHMNGFDPANCYISHFANGLWDFTSAGSVASESSSVYSIQRTGVTSLSPFTVGDQSSGVLPISLLQFDAQKENSSVQLNWTTTSELNNMGYELQRMMNAADFVPIAFINGAGNSNTTIHYAYNDINPTNGSEGIVYYRLKQIDFDGESSLSKTIAVRFDNSIKDEIVLFPNPSSGIVNFSHLHDINTVELRNHLGLLMDQIQNPQENILDLSNYASGVYIVTFIGTNTNKSFKVVKNQ